MSEQYSPKSGTSRSESTNLDGAPSNQQPLLRDVEAQQSGRNPTANSNNHDTNNDDEHEDAALLGFQRAARNVMRSRKVLRNFERRGESMGRKIFQNDSIMGSGGSLVRQHHDEVQAPGVVSPLQDVKAIAGLFTSSWLNLLIVCVPLGWLAQLLHWGPYPIFILNFVALVPLALILGEVTEDLAVRFGDTVGGLLNATFGNVVELVLSLAALSKGLYTVVAMSLIGSILSNLLLVMGFCFLCGGTKFKEQKFSMLVNKACCSLLFLACIGLSVPTASSALYGKERMPESAEKNVSRVVAVLLIFVYICYLLFQLKTHGEMFVGDDDQETPSLSLAGALVTLAGITIVVAISSEFLTGAIEEVSKKSGLNQAFLGLIVLPIAGNACEHITAVFVAVKDKMDLAIGVALGSSIQIAVFVMPVMVLAGWAIGKDFTLTYIDPFASMFLTLSVVHAYFVSSDGHSNWLMGVQLISTYTLIAMLYLLLAY